MATERPLLYTYRRCPYAMRARMALLIAGIPFDAHEIELRHKPPAMLAASPKGTVPVLVLPGGQVLEQSWDIVEWALNHCDATGNAQVWWRNASTPDCQALMHLNDSDFKHHLDRYKYPERYGEVNPEDKPALLQVHRQQALEVFLIPLEARLRDHPFLGGQTPCATDIGIFPFVRQFAAVDAGWFEGLPLPGVRAWLQGWTRSALFEACMHKLAVNVPMAFEPRMSKAPVIRTPTSFDASSFDNPEP